MNDFDLEDIESYYYSQIYHSNVDSENDIPNQIVDNPQETVEDMRRPNRYYQAGPTRVGNKFQKKRFGQPNLNTAGYKERNPYPHQETYSKNYHNPSYEANKSVNEYSVMSPHQNLYKTSNRQVKKALRKENIQNIHKKQISQNTPTPSKSSTDVKPTHKRFDVTNKDVDPSIIGSVVIISDSEQEEEDSCIVIPQVWPHLSVVDSEDENEGLNTINELETSSTDARNFEIEKNDPHKTSDDVIFVEPDNAPDEIINLDEESILQKPTESTVTPTKSSTYLPRERKELLSTPDSTSNDFMINPTVSTSQTNFNFGLHGSDFKDSEFVKPAKPNETCETESSSSTTDLNHMKTVVFSEIEFPREDIFSEANLESFGNFITPVRNRSRSIHSSTPHTTASNIDLSNVLSDSSGSDSDSENATTACKPKEFKQNKVLPELSEMEVVKPKKTINLSSKYDLINNEENLEGFKTKKRKSTDLNNSKRKTKSKKKKVSESIVDDTVVEKEAEVTATTKRKSVSEDESSSKRKNKNKKKRSDRSISVEGTETSDSNDNKKNDKESMASERVTAALEVGTDSENKRKSISSLSEEDSGRKKNKSKKKKSDTSMSVDSPEPAFATATTSDLPPIKQETAQKQNQVKENNIDGTFDIFVKEEVDQSAKQNNSVKMEKVSGKSAAEQPTTSTSTQNERVLESESVQVTVEYVNNVKVDPEPINTKQEVGHSEKKPIVDSLIDNSIFEGLEVVDETFAGQDVKLHLSDSDSNLSALHEGGHDIQLGNCKQLSPVIEEKPVVEKDRKKLNLANNSVKELQDLMTDDPNCWKILNRDNVCSTLVSLTRRQKRCSRCKELGHTAIKCQTRLEIVCRLCGAHGHYEPRCPNKLCTQCGQRSQYSTTYCKYCFKLRYYTCNICCMSGHREDRCPDLWRRYHLTVTEGAPLVYQETIGKIEQQLWCCGCAQPGHLEHSCPWFKGQYPRTDPYIKKYDDVLFHSKLKPPIQQRLGPPVNNQTTSTDSQSDNYAVQSIPSLLDLEVDKPQEFLNLNLNQFGDPQQAAPLNNFCFESNLPNFISFDAGSQHEIMPQSRQQQDLSVSSEDDLAYESFQYGRKPEYYDKILLKSNVRNVKHFINGEFNWLRKTQENIKAILKNLKQYFQRSSYVKITKLKLLNTIIFGIYYKEKGKHHLDRIKRLYRQMNLSKLDRKKLLISYNYIFAKEKKNINYKEIILKI